MVEVNSEIDRRYWEASRPVLERLEILLEQMTVAEKAGLLFHTMITIGPNGELADADPAFGLPSTEEFVLGKKMSHFNLLGTAPPVGVLARWHNHIQQLAASTRLGIPVTISTDPRHSFSENIGVTFMAGPFSQWPEPLGLAATRDADLVREYADIVRQEYAAVGIRVALHPQVDLATEPRWSRQLQTFGEDPDLAGELGAAYIRGLQGEPFGPGSVSAMVKHFPGGGPQKDGEDPHFAYGREQVYPGDAFQTHLRPFERALEVGVRQVMPYYGMPVGTTLEEVGFGFNKQVLTGLLRERYGFDGIVCTDWGLITDSEIMGSAFPARAWGVEHLTPAQRIVKVLDAGADQFGGEKCVELLIELVGSGDVPEGRLDVSARRILREKFLLGLFDNPYVDVDQAESVVGSEPFRAAGERAQRKSVTVLTNVDAALPIRAGLKWYVEGLSPETAAEYGTVVATAAEADVAILRLAAPYEQRGTMFENFFHAGSLEFPTDVIDHVRQIAATTTTIVDVFLDRPAILGPIVDAAHAVVATWGANAGALLDVLTGAAVSQGKLPFDIPRSTAAVVASAPDLPFDTEDPQFRFGHGL